MGRAHLLAFRPVEGSARRVIGREDEVLFDAVVTLDDLPLGTVPLTLRHDGDEAFAAGTTTLRRSPYTSRRERLRISVWVDGGDSRASGGFTSGAGLFIVDRDRARETRLDLRTRPLPFVVSHTSPCPAPDDPVPFWSACRTPLRDGEVSPSGVGIHDVLTAAPGALSAVRIEDGRSVHLTPRLHTASGFVQRVNGRHWTEVEVVVDAATPEGDLTGSLLATFVSRDPAVQGVFLDVVGTLLPADRGSSTVTLACFTDARFALSEGHELPGQPSSCPVAPSR